MSTCLERDPPQDEHEAVQRLRAELRRMTDLAEQLLLGDVPKRGRSLDDRESFSLWHEDAASAIYRAKESLNQTAEFSDTVCTAVPIRTHKRKPPRLRRRGSERAITTE